MMKYIIFPKGTCIYKQGDLCDKFYGIIKGSVSIRKRCKKLIWNSLINGYQHSIEETETSLLLTGMCFGEWELINNMPHPSFAYAVSDCHMFYLDKEYFINTFEKEIIKSDIDKKSFVTRIIPALLQGCGKLNEINHAIVPCFYEQNQLVYSEKDKAENIYVLFQGECMVTKFANVNKIDNPMLHKDKMIHLFKIDRGAIVGLETIVNGVNYNTNVLVCKNFTVFYRINIQFIKTHLHCLYKFFYPLYKEHTVLVNTMWDKEKEKFLFKTLLPRKSRNTNNTSININNNNHYGIYNTTNTNAHHELLTQLKESPDQKESIILSHKIYSYADSMIKSMSFISQRELSQIKQRKHYKTIIDINKLKTIYNDTNANSNTKSTKNVHIKTSNTEHKDIPICLKELNEFKAMCAKHKLHIKPEDMELFTKGMFGKKKKKQLIYSSIHKEENIATIIRSLSKPRISPIRSNSNSKLNINYNSGYYNLPLLSS